MIIRSRVADEDRVTHTASLFDHHFPLHLEPLVYATADHLSADYRGGYWDFFTLSNKGFFMAPAGDKHFCVVAENCFEGDLSADAFGITACLYAYSHLSFSGILGFAGTCAQQFHQLRAYALEHAEAGAILAAID